LTLSWGRAPEPEPQPRRWPPLRRITVSAVGVVVAALVLSDDAPRTATTQNEREALVTLLSARRAALLSRDRVAFLGTIDPYRASYAECQRQIFDVQARTGTRPPVYYLGRIEHMGEYVNAWVDDGPGLRRMFFRKVEGRWLFSEPLESDLGSRRTRTLSGVEVRYWPIDEEVVGFLDRELVTVRRTVVEHAPAPITTLFTLTIDPLSDPRGGRSCFVEGQAGVSNYSPNTSITLRALWLNAGYNALAQATRAALEHEALHWIQADHSASAMRAMDWWLVEGWPTLIAEPAPARRINGDLCVRAPPTYKEMHDGPIGGAPEETTRSYRIASTMVDHLIRTRGDAGYWMLVDAYRTTADPKEAYRSIGSDPDTFYAEWLAATRSRYCD